MRHKRDMYIHYERSYKRHYRRTRRKTMGVFIILLLALGIGGFTYFFIMQM